VGESAVKKGSEKAKGEKQKTTTGKMTKATGFDKTPRPWPVSAAEQASTPASQPRDKAKSPARRHVGQVVICGASQTYMGPRQPTLGRSCPPRSRPKPPSPADRKIQNSKIQIQTFKN
jgi:hypothetical protein